MARIAFVAGGGAVKAYAFHVGVLRGMLEDGFELAHGTRWRPSRAHSEGRIVDCYVGSSAGACVVASIASGRRVEELREAILGLHREIPRFGLRTIFTPVAPHPLRYVDRLRKRWRVAGLRPHHLLDLGGLVTARGVERYFRQHVLPTNRFADLSPELYLTATHVNDTFQAVFGKRDSRLSPGAPTPRRYINTIRISEAIAAAISIPPVFAPYPVVDPATGQTEHYYDGEVRETLSSQVARERGAELIIVSSIWRPYQHDERVGTLAHLGMSVLLEQALHQSIEQKIDEDRRRHRAYDDLLALLAARDRAGGVPAEQTESLLARVCELLEHRPCRTLYVAPVPEDLRFFFDGWFRFDAETVDRAIESGTRGYRAARAREGELSIAPARG